MRTQRCLGWAVVALLAPALARADEPTRPTAAPSETNPAVPAPGHSVHGEAYNDGPRRKAHLMEGMGAVAFGATTDSPEARALIDQGVAQLHSFFYLEAERSFRQAATIDPDCAIAYWGMAMANTNNARRAKGFLKDAQKPERLAGASAREKRYVEALGAFYKEGADEKARRQDWLKGLEAIVQEYPEDTDARAWMAMVAWQNGGKDGIGSRQAVDMVLDSVLRDGAMHPGGHHYRIHLWDNVKPERALKSAALYGPAAPGIAHAWHMPGHTYTGLKRYADAAYQQEASARVDHAYMARERVMPFEIHNYAHNNQWLCTSLGHVGRARDAIAVARNLVEQPRDPQKNGPNDGGSPQRSGRLRWAETLVRYELWDDLIAATESGALDWSDVPFEKIQRASTLGLAYAARGDRAKLAEQVAALKTLADGAKPKREEAKSSEKAPPTPVASAAEAALAELEGHQRLLDGDVGAAFDRFARATAMRPEALARAHLAARNFGLAESTARLAVEKAPNQVPPRAALVEILHATGKEDEARAAYRKLEPLARDADRDLPVFRRLAEIVAGWEDRPAPAETPTDEAAVQRIDLTTLGPLTWSPWPAEPLVRDDTDGARWALEDHRGRNVVVLFYLGGQCAHCMQQLQLFGKETEALKALGTDVVAVSTDDREATEALKENDDAIAFPMPLLADPSLGAFKAYGVFDDFEGQPLHGTFLIDARGLVRYQRIGADPFLDVEFIKKEAARVNRLTR